MFYFRLLFFVLTFCTYPSFAASINEAGASSVSGHYECLWWSESQMEGLDPNRPPNKETVTVIDRWEYSDPIAVPHPDIITLAAYIPLSIAGDISVKTQWLKHKWSKEIDVKPLLIQDVDQNMRLIKVDIPVKNYIYTNRPKKMRAVIKVGKHSLAVFDLPIVMGD